LVEKVRQLITANRQPLRLWVPFADCKQEDSSNYLGVAAIARLLNLQFQPCPVIWAAYYATNELAGEDLPIEPVTVPARPKSSLKAVLIAAVLLAASTTSIPKELQSIVTKAEETFPAVGTKAWGDMNHRRAQLIRKKHRQGLSLEEQSEYEVLQRLSRAALEKRFHRPIKTTKGLLAWRPGCVVSQRENQNDAARTFCLSPH
jgi:hypothetical protein